MRTIVAATAATLLLPAAVHGQSSSPLTPEVSVAVGLGHVFRFEDQTFGDRLNLGGSLAVAHRSGWTLELEANQTRELTPRPVPCGVVGVTCVGTGHDGPRSMRTAAAVVQYRFKAGRFRPYVLAGLGAMSSTSLHSTTRVIGSQAFITEDESSDTGIGPDLGAGVRIPLSKNLSVNPEIRWLEGAWLSRQNLSVTRVTLRAAYSW